MTITDQDTLHDALKALGLKFTVNGGYTYIDTPAGRITLYNGKAEFEDSGCQKWVNKIKQAVSAKIIEKVFKKHKMTVTVKGGTKDSVAVMIGRKF